LFQVTFDDDLVRAPLAGDVHFSGSGLVILNSFGRIEANIGLLNILREAMDVDGTLAHLALLQVLIDEKDHLLLVTHLISIFFQIPFEIIDTRCN
jgi:hypothetical protein